MTTDNPASTTTTANPAPTTTGNPTTPATTTTDNPAPAPTASDTLILHINKIIANIDKDELEYNSDERGKTVDVTVIDTDDSAMDLSNKTIRFCEQKESGKVIIDQDGDPNESGKGGKFTKVDEEAKAGHFTYEFSEYVYQASGDAWFEFVTDDNHIDISNKFHITIDKATSLDINNDNYVSSLEAETSHYNAQLDALTATKDKLNSDITTALNNFSAEMNQNQQAWQKQTADIQTAANQQIADAKKAASDQLASDTQAAKDQRDSEASTFNSTLQDQVNQIESARDAAIKAANDAYAAQRTQLASDFADWQKTEHDSYAKTLADIQTHIDQLQNTDIPGMDAKVKDLQAKIAQAEQDAQDATAKFNSIDITKYELKSDLANDYYNKTETDSLLAQAGKLKSVSVNGGDKVQPDSSGNADLTIPKQDMSDYYTKEDINQLKGSRTVDAPDFNTLTDSGIYYISNPSKGKNFPPVIAYGVLTVFNGSNNGDTRIMQIYAPDNGQGLFVRTPYNSNKDAMFTDWNQIAWKSDITNLMSMQQTLQTTVSSNQTDIATIKNTLKDSALFKPITQADYDALTDDEKANGMYAIGDSN